MATLTCRNLAKDCLDTLTAADSKEIQKVFHVHVRAKHPLQWNQFTAQFKAIALVTIRDRFIAQGALDLKTGTPVVATPSILSEAGSSGAAA